LKIAERPGEPELKCLWMIGCRGPVTKADCPIRKWNGGVNFCISANAPCIGCVEPSFPGKEPSPKGFYQHVANPNVGSPKVFAQPFQLDLKSMAESSRASPASLSALSPMGTLALAGLGVGLAGLAALMVKARSRRVKEVEGSG